MSIETTNDEGSPLSDHTTKTMILDKTGREILPGDLLKVFHFIGARRKRYYMYKYVESIEFHGKNPKEFIKLNHLSSKGLVGDVHYWVMMDDKIHPEYEIVQGYGKDADHFEDRKRHKPTTLSNKGEQV